MTHSEEELRKRVSDLLDVPWFHTLRLFPDLVIKGAKTSEILEAERAAILGVLDLTNRSVVDVGTWNGYFAFEAKRAGASRVIATDSFVWRHPILRGRETFEIARACLGVEVESKEIDPTELPGDIEPVDVVLFLGVFYHLFDPIMVLQKTASIATDLLIIETHQDLLSINRPAMVFYPGTTLKNDPTNWWGPNPECLVELLHEVGFKQVYYQHNTTEEGRGIYHAFRSTKTAKLYLREAADNVVLFDLESEAGRQAIFAKTSSDSLVAERDAALAGIAERDAAIATAVVERDAALARVDALHGSISWKLTSPLRALSSIIRRDERD